MNDKWISLHRAARLLSSTRWRVQQLVLDGSVEGVRVGGKTFVARRDVEQIVAKRQQVARVSAA